MKPLVQLRGRGAASNPPNRFERLAYVAEADGPDLGSAPRTHFLRDSTRSLIVRNTSPDVAFDFGINVYRGCENGCSYCLDGDTRILMGDGSTRALRDLRIGDEIYGTRRDGWFRRYTRTRVLDHWSVERQAYRITLDDGTELIASGDHRFLTERGWKHVTGTEQGSARRPHLTLNNKLMGVGGLSTTPAESGDYRRGYLCGMVRGDANLASYCYTRGGRVHDVHHRFRLALADEDALHRTGEYLQLAGIETKRFLFQAGSEVRRPMEAIRTQSRAGVARIRELVEWPFAPSPDWNRGFLAGIFDSEGSYSGGILRIANTETEILERTMSSLRQLGFACVLESSPSRRVRYVRVTGGLREHLRFFHIADPAIPRKRDIEGQAVKSGARLGIRSIVPVGPRLLYDISTESQDFIANGVVSHNCFARPTHEFLGFSAGLDFETRILVKEDAPELLRDELSARSWQPAVLGMSGVTDPYQPIERELRITRRCLEVLAECRNPVAVITKRHLVTRDADLLGELARHGAASVSLSITTLDPELQRRMEPRASTPARRLEAISVLADAGVPVGVLVAPVIPGLTDHEIPRILEAASAAGASFASHVMLRLPHGVKELFSEWLEAHFPERKEKVLGHVRGMRGGALYDPRFHVRGRGEGAYAAQINALFSVTARRLGLDTRYPALSTASFRRPSGAQLQLAL